LTSLVYLAFPNANNLAFKKITVFGKDKLYFNYLKTRENIYFLTLHATFSVENLNSGCELRTSSALN
jgi:hypothetical protein